MMAFQKRVICGFWVFLEIFFSFMAFFFLQSCCFFLTLKVSEIRLSSTGGGEGGGGGCWYEFFCNSQGAYIYGWIFLCGQKMFYEVEKNNIQKLNFFKSFGHICKAHGHSIKTHEWVAEIFSAGYIPKKKTIKIIRPAKQQISAVQKNDVSRPKNMHTFAVE